ncbi:MAG TPA: preprotein translocase subunit SecG [Alphaproteobacteria bacterium]|nr:preprotein translocase subunit SecG [Alphaproteobacteria bacterium]
MEQVVLVIHLLIALALVAVVLLQRSEGGGLGMGGGGGGGGMMSVRGTANLLTRATAVLAGCFMATSMILAILAGNDTQPSSIVEEVPAATEAPADQGIPAVPLGN